MAPAAARRPFIRLVDAVEPSVDLALGLVLGHAIALLKSAAELCALASITLRSSLVSLPHFCWTLPLNVFQLPSTRSQFIACSCEFGDSGRTRRGSKSSDAQRVRLPEQDLVHRPEIKTGA